MRVGAERACWGAPQGALMVGHNCGGLGKMPGFYFTSDLDNIQDMAHRRVALTAERPGSLVGLAHLKHVSQEPSENFVSTFLVGVQLLRRTNRK